MFFARYNATRYKSICKCRPERRRNLSAKKNFVETDTKPLSLPPILHCEFEREFVATDVSTASSGSLNVKIWIVSSSQMVEQMRRERKICSKFQLSFERLHTWKSESRRRAASVFILVEAGIEGSQIKSSYYQKLRGRSK